MLLVSTKGHPNAVKSQCPHLGPVGSIESVRLSVFPFTRSPLAIELVGQGDGIIRLQGRLCRW